jgi:hypothetical protein
MAEVTKAQNCDTIKIQQLRYIMNYNLSAPKNLAEVFADKLERGLYDSVLQPKDFYTFVLANGTKYTIEFDEFNDQVFWWKVNDRPYLASHSLTISLAKFLRANPEVCLQVIEKVGL